MKEVVKTGILGVLLAGISLVVAYGVWAFYQTPKNVAEGGEMTVCTADAMQCPNGTYVGRTGPNCQFVCPTTDTSPKEETTIRTKLGVAGQGLGISIIPLTVVQDSRCPTDVQCVWAGTVTLKVLIESGLGASTQELSLGESVTTEAETVTLTSVSPAASSVHTITSEEYLFTFTITKRN
jgi:hypothetical protein